jgi:hypothetical protein
VARPHDIGMKFARSAGSSNVVDETDYDTLRARRSSQSVSLVNVM